MRHHCYYIKNYLKNNKILYQIHNKVIFEKNTIFFPKIIPLIKETKFFIILKKYYFSHIKKEKNFTFYKFFFPFNKQ